MLYILPQKIGLLLASETHGQQLSRLFPANVRIAENIRCSQRSVAVRSSFAHHAGIHRHRHQNVVLNGELHAFGQVHLKLHLTTARGGSAANITGSLPSFRKNGHNVDLDAHLWVTEGGKPHGSPDGGVVRHVMAEPLGHRLVNLVSKPPRGTSSPGLDAPSPHQR